MRDEGDDEAPDAALLARLIETSLGGIPTTPFGRLSRLAGSMARAGATLGLKRLTSGVALDEAAIERLVRSLGQLKGVAMKAGQILSYADETLPPEAQRILSSLPDGSEVAVKVQYPDIEAALVADFRAAAGGARFARLIAPGGNVDDFIAEARERVLAECDYGRELAFQQRFRKIFARHPLLRVPKAHPPYSSRRVLTSSWEDGLRLDEWLRDGPSQDERNRVGEALYEFYVGSLLRHGVFNADPHPGNYLFRSDGKVVMLDYGCVREFPAARVDGIRRLRESVWRTTRGAARSGSEGAPRRRGICGRADPAPLVLLPDARRSRPAGPAHVPDRAHAAARRQEGDREPEPARRASLPLPDPLRPARGTESHRRGSQLASARAGLERDGAPTMESASVLVIHMVPNGRRSA